MSLVELDRLTWPQAEAIDAAAIGLVAVGATEQHGPHLPMGTDTEIARALAAAMAARIREPVVVPPPIACGLSEHHVDFAGTITLSETVLGGLLDAYLEGLGRLGIRRVALISGHGGNFAFLGDYADRCAERHPGSTVVAYRDLWSFVRVAAEALRPLGLDPVECDAHAGLIETSIALHLYEGGAVADFDDVEGYVAAEPGWAERAFGQGLRAFTATGVLGRPAGATADAGRAIMDALADQLAGWAVEQLGVTRADDATSSEGRPC